MPKPGKTISADVSASAVRFDESSMWVELSDGRTLGVPLVWFPRLLRATAEQRAGFRLGPFGIHWDELDEDVSIEGVLAGRRDGQGTGERAA